MQHFFASVSLLITLISLVKAAPFHSDILLRSVRGANQRHLQFPAPDPLPLDQDQDLSDFNVNQNPQDLGAEIRKEIGKPTVNVNRNTGASSSTSLTNTVLATHGKNGPQLKNGQALAVGISIRGPLGGATNDTFSNVALFGADSGDFGDAFANAGQAGRGKSGTQTGTNIHLQNNDPNAPGFASSFNNAKTNIFSSGQGNGGQFAGAGAFGDVGGGN